MNWKRHRARINYVVDVAIGLGFLISAASGMILFFAGTSGGYQGGRNPSYVTAVAGMSRELWKDLHTWSSIVMAVGALGHLLLHWNWLVCMTRNIFRKKRKQVAVGAITTDDCCTL